MCIHIGTKGKTCDETITQRFYLSQAYYHCDQLDSIGSTVDLLQYLLQQPTLSEIMYKKVLDHLEQVWIKFQKKMLPWHLRRIIAILISCCLAFEKRVAPTDASLLTYPWILFHRIMMDIEDSDDELTTPHSILVLKLAHEILGRYKKCTVENGRFLRYTLQVLLGSEKYLEYAESDEVIEHSLFCLYGYGRAKTKAIRDHCANPQPLIWAQCASLYKYLRPEKLPEFDSYFGITSETRAIFYGMCAAVPEKLRPRSRFAELESWQAGKLQKVLEETPDWGDMKEMCDLYYLMGDFHFKSKEWESAIEYYMYDIALNGERFDSWAAMALARAEQVNLDSDNSLNIEEVISAADSAIRSFRRALALEPENMKIRIEFGSFVYSMHSFCSRAIKGRSDLLDLTTFALLEEKKDAFLTDAKKCFEPVVHGDCPGDDMEGWLHHYMLGKVLEKAQPEEFPKFCKQYLKSAELLAKSAAPFPLKINYYNPPDLALEAIEMHYR